MMRKGLYFSLFMCMWYVTSGQQSTTVYGKITNQQGKPLEAVNVVIIGGGKGTVTDSSGYYQLQIPSGSEIVIGFSFVGYKTQRRILKLKKGQRKELNVTMVEYSVELEEVSVKGEKKERNEISTHKITPKNIEKLPSPTQGVEGIIKTLPGVTSNNELSTQYSVRGGNFDENLVYVNDFEIYRPFLISSSQQEGLSFVNSDLVSSIKFSTGGFQPQYGDKMSSVLDVTYKEPDTFSGSASASLLGGSLHLEGSTKNNRFTYLGGVRYKSNQYLLNSLDVKGEYKPAFTDIQTYLTYDLNDKLELGWLGYYSNNKYEVIPIDRETRLGTIKDVLNFKVFFDGKEIDQFKTAQTGLSLTYNVHDQLQLKWLASAYRTDEKETSDIIGQYWLDAVETDLGDEDFGQTLFSLGVGTYHEWRRNFLTATVANGAHKGTYSKGAHLLQWGARYQHEIIDDKLHEWLRRDSAGYSLPFSDTAVFLSEVRTTQAHLNSNRYTAYIQDKWTIDPFYEMVLTGGVRLHYWDLNEEWLVSPRAQFSFKPRWEPDIVFKLASGYYYQSPFYRELRDREGNVHRDVKAQKSIHFVAGGDWHFTLWKRPFKFVTEVYYKHLRQLNPYTIRDVRVRYFGENSAKGYATGIDMRLHGEFVKGAESWASLSIMDTKEHIEGDYVVAEQAQTEHNGICSPWLEKNNLDVFCNTTHYEEGDTIKPHYRPRPTDQRLTFSMFFQDYIPQHQNYKVHLNFIFGTGLPFGPPESIELRNVFRIPPYRRVDIGFSALLYDEQRKTLLDKVKFLKNLNSLWITAEIFNLLKVSNTVSYFWVKDINNTLYGIPNYLTSRRINVKLKAEF